MNSWTEIALEDAMEAIIDYRGKTPTKTKFGVPLVTAKIVKGGRIEEPTEFIAESDYEDWMRRGFPKAGDVVITTEAPLGEVAQLDSRKIALAQRLICLRGKPSKLDNTFLKFLLQSSELQARLNARASGSTVLGIRQSELRKVFLPLPPIAVQRAIGDLLGSLDDKIEQNRRTSRKLEELARGMFKAWLVDFEPVYAKAAGAISYPGMPAKAFDLLPTNFQSSEFGNIPVGWDHRSLYSTATYINGAAFKSTHFCEPADGLPVVKIAELKGGITSQTKYSNRTDIAAKYRIDTGDTLYSWSGNPDTSLDVFRWSFGPGLLNQHIFKVVTENNAEKHFVYYLLRHLRSDLVEIARDKQTTGLGHVTIEDMKRLKVCRPADNALDSFAEVVGPMYDFSFKLELESNKLAALRDYLLPKLLSGQVRIKNAQREVADAS